MSTELLDIPSDTTDDTTEDVIHITKEYQKPIGDLVNALCGVITPALGPWRNVDNICEECLFRSNHSPR